MVQNVNKLKFLLLQNLPLLPCTESTFTRIRDHGLVDNGEERIADDDEDSEGTFSLQICSKIFFAMFLQLWSV